MEILNTSLENQIPVFRNEYFELLSYISIIDQKDSFQTFGNQQKGLLTSTPDLIILAVIQKRLNIIYDTGLYFFSQSAGPGVQRYISKRQYQGLFYVSS
jgi:hypothetical protein